MEKITILDFIGSIIDGCQHDHRHLEELIKLPVQKSQQTNSNFPINLSVMNVIDDKHRNLPFFCKIFVECFQDEIFI